MIDNQTKVFYFYMKARITKSTHFNDCQKYSMHQRLCYDPLGFSVLVPIIGMHFTHLPYDNMMEGEMNMLWLLYRKA